MALLQNKTELPKILHDIKYTINKHTFIHKDKHQTPTQVTQTQHYSKTNKQCGARQVKSLMASFSLNEMLKMARLHLRLRPKLKSSS